MKPTIRLFTAALAALLLLTAFPATADDAVLTREHTIPLLGGGWVAATETYTEAALEARPRRAALLFNGSAFNRHHWSIPVENYDGPSILARAGWIAFTVDYLGVGDSFVPADGRDASFEAQIDAMSVALDYVRAETHVQRVDLMGPGYGGAIAVVLAADPSRVRSTVTSAMLYDSPPIAGPLTDPAFIEMLENDADGYFFLPGEASLFFMIGAPQEALDYVAATQGGFYPVDNFLAAAYELPFFDASAARVPGLVIFGPLDLVVGPNGVDGLLADYGPRGARLATRPDANHAPRVENPEIAAWYWEQSLAFLNRPHHPTGPPTAP